MSFIPRDLRSLGFTGFAALLAATVFFLFRAIFEIGLALALCERGFSIGHGTSRGCWSASIAENAPRSSRGWRPITRRASL